MKLVRKFQYVTIYYVNLLVPTGAQMLEHSAQQPWRCASLLQNTAVLYGRDRHTEEGRHCTTWDFPYGNRMYSLNTDFRPGTTQWNSSTSYTPKENITERAEQTDSRPPSQPLQARTNSISTKFAERIYLSNFPGLYGEQQIAFDLGMLRLQQQSFNGDTRTSELPVWGTQMRYYPLTQRVRIFRCKTHKWGHGVRPTNEDITAMNDNTTKWMTDVADTIWWRWTSCVDHNGRARQTPTRRKMLNESQCFALGKSWFVSARTF